MRLIDADEMLKRAETWNTEDWMDKALYNFMRARIIEQPTVDAVEVVRCKDCIHRTKNGMCEYKDYSVVAQDDNDFCSWGERREDAN